MNTKELKTNLRQFVKTYPIYQIIKTPFKELLITLLNNYQQTNTKVKEVILIPQGKHKVFRFILDNEIPISLGLNKLLSNPKNKSKNKFIRDCRSSIQTQIKNYYETQIKSGKVKVTKTKLVVDHVYPFSKLLEDFCLLNKINLETIDKENNNYNNYIAMFSKYHKENCKLQLLPEKLNSQKGNKLNFF